MFCMYVTDQSAPAGWSYVADWVYQCPITGGVACWAFVTCINVLDICAEIPADHAAQQGIGVHTASLYDQARLKVGEGSSS